jgi:PilZ domain
MRGHHGPLPDLSLFHAAGLAAGRAPPALLALLAALAAALLALALALLLRRRLGHWLRMRLGRGGFERVAAEASLAPPQRALLRRLMRLAASADAGAFLRDARAFERAAERVAAEGDEATLAALGGLRRALQLDVMNPVLELICTRQLLADLPVRLLATLGEERLDLYCTLLEVNEGYLLLDLPQEPDLLALLERHPHAFLIYWREREGEAAFRITLEPVGPGSFPALRARHAFRDPGAEHRNAFRLSVDLPVTYQFLDRGELGRRVGRSGPAPAQEGQGRLADLSYGGASLVVPEPLAERGLAQLGFTLRGEPLRLVLEVLSRAPTGDGRHQVRGQFRGLGAEARVRLRTLLNREQIERLRDRERLRIRTGAGSAGS